MNSKLSLTRKFLISSAAAFLFIGGLLSYIANYELKTYLLNKTKEDVSGQIVTQTEKNLPKEMFKRTDYILQKPLFDKYSKEIDYLNFEKIKIYNIQGTVIYSNQADIVGQTFKDNELNDALEGNTNTNILSSQKEEFKNEDIGKYIELYIPIFYKENAPLGVVEVYFNIANFNKEIYNFEKNIFVVTFATLAGLYLILYWLFKKASDTIFDTNNDLADATRALKMGQEQDEAIMESMGEGLIMINPDGQILLVNPKAESTIGYPSQEVVFRHYRKFIDLRDIEGKKIKEDLVGKSLKEGVILQKTHRENLSIKNQDGTLIPVSLTIAPIFDRKNSSIRGVVFTIHNARAEKELDKVKDEFVYVVAHELGNPIFTIDGYLSLVLDGTLGKVDKKVKDIITTVRTVNKQLSGLVTDLLEVIREETGQMKFELEPIDLSIIAKEVIQDMKIKASSRKISINYEQQKLPLVTGNKNKIQEIFINLIDNAIKYSPDNTEIRISHDIQKGEVVTSVSDQGIGMTEAEAANLFEKFYRIRNNETKNIPGTGLGLFIVRTILRKMNGDISVDSHKGKGSKFSFKLKIN